MCVSTMGERKWHSQCIRGRGRRQVAWQRGLIFQASTFFIFFDMYNTIYKYKSFSYSHSLCLYTRCSFLFFPTNGIIFNMRTVSLLIFLTSVRGILGGVCTKDQCADAITAIGEINVGLQSRSLDCAKFIATTVTPNASSVISTSSSYSWLIGIGLL